MHLFDSIMKTGCFKNKKIISGDLSEKKQKSESWINPENQIKFRNG